LGGQEEMRAYRAAVEPVAANGESDPSRTSAIRVSQRRAEVPLEHRPVPVPSVTIKAVRELGVVVRQSSLNMGQSAWRSSRS